MFLNKKQNLHNNILALLGAKKVLNKWFKQVISVL